MITPENVQVWLQLPAVDAVVIVATEATIALVESWPFTPRTPEGEWTAQSNLAATMLAARLYRRRNSPSGVEALTEAGASYVSRYDSDIARLLRMDSFTPPQVG